MQKQVTRLVHYQEYQANKYQMASQMIQNKKKFFLKE